MRGAMPVSTLNHSGRKLVKKHLKKGDLNTISLDPCGPVNVLQTILKIFNLFYIQNISLHGEISTTLHAYKMEEVTTSKFNLDQFEFNMNEQNAFSMLIFLSEELVYCLHSECYIN